MTIEIDQGALKAVSSRTFAALDRIKREQGEVHANAAALYALHSAVAYLREAIGDVDVVEMLGELRETVLSSALNGLRALR